MDVLVGRYQVRGILGRGGMAEVRDGWDTQLSRPVAIKLLYPALAADRGQRRRFEDEARAAAALNHPNVVAVHDSGEQRGTPFIVMERLSGHTLADEIAAGPLPVPRVRGLLDQILSALAAAHAAGVLHRDIKPANVLIGPSGEAKLADFGIAKTDGAALTQTGQVVGTMAYLSPQRVMGHPAGVTDDLYAVGVLGYELLCGRRPFEHDNPAAMVRAVLDDEPASLATLRPDVDPVLIGVVETAMARNPDYRFPDAAAMRAALTGQAPATVRFGAAVKPATKVLTAALPPMPMPVPVAPAVSPVRRSRLPLVLGLVAVAAAVILGVVLLVAGRPSPAPPPQVVPVTSTPVVPVTTSLPPPSSSAPVDDGPGQGKGKGHGKNKEHPKKKGNPHD